MKLYFVLLATTIAVSCRKMPISQPDSLGDSLYSSHPKHDLYQPLLENYRKTTGSPGSILLVKRNNENSWIGATGSSNLTYNSRMRTNQQFRTGSITKILTAVIILQLVDQGKLTLESKLSNYIPALSRYIPQNNQITIRHLLAHLSGIYDPSNENLGYQADILNHPQKMANMSVADKMHKYVSGRKLAFNPGSAYAYSNTNYWLLGAIAEELTGKPLNRLFNENIYTPLAMNSTYLQVKDDRNVARGYADLYKNGQLLDVTLFDKAEGDAEADGGLISTAEDLCKLMEGLFSGQLLPLPLVEEMKRKQLPSCNITDCEYGLGLERWQTKAGIAYGHNGALLGNEANALYYPDQKAIVVLYKNKGNGSNKDFLDDLVR